MKVAIIGSTGLSISDFCDTYSEKEISIDNTLVKYMQGSFNEHDILFFSRNLNRGVCPPHGVQYQLIMKTIKTLNVDAILATSVVGGLREEYGPGEYVILDQFLDFTKHRVFTAFSNDEFAFVDFTNPYCESLRKVLIEACNEAGVKYHSQGCYVGVDGPRYETAAEVRAYALLGGDVVGMTNIPEVVLAREYGLCYASVALIVNYGAGISAKPILRQDCYDATMDNVYQTVIILRNALFHLSNRVECDCAQKPKDIVKNK